MAIAAAQPGRPRRPELARLLGNLREEDVVVVTRIDRLARLMRDLPDVTEWLRGASAGLRSVAVGSANTAPPRGRVVRPPALVSVGIPSEGGL